MGCVCALGFSYFFSTVAIFNYGFNNLFYHVKYFQEKYFINKVFFILEKKTAGEQVNRCAKSAH